MHCALKVWHGMNGQSVEGLAQCPLPVSSLIRDRKQRREAKNNSVPGHTTMLPVHLQHPTYYR